MGCTYIHLQFEERKLTAEFFKIVDEIFLSHGLKADEAVRVSPPKSLLSPESIPFSHEIERSKFLGELSKIVFFSMWYSSDEAGTLCVRVYGEVSKDQTGSQLSMEASIEERGEYTAEEKARALAVEDITLQLHKQLNAFDSRGHYEGSDSAWFHFSKDEWKPMGDLSVCADEAASVEFELPPKSLPADGRSRTRLAIIARDKSGKLVDGAAVCWHVEKGMGELIEREEETKEGRASATLVSSGHGDEMIVSAQVDSPRASVTIPIRNLKITLTPESESLSTDAAAGTFPSRTRVTATIVDEDGTPVADGTTINWFVSAGTFEKDDASVGNVIETEALDGHASVWVNAEGARAGTVLLCVGVTSFFQSRRLQFVAPPGLVVTTDHLVLAADALADGTREVQRMEGEPFQAPFFTAAKFTILGGKPLHPAEIHLWGDGAIYVELVGNGVIELNADGNGCFRLKSNGTYPKGDVRFYPICVTISQGRNEAAAEIRVGPSNGYAQVYDIGHLLPWGDLDGWAAAEEFAGGMIFGNKTPRDLALQLGMFAGAEEISFAVMGIFATHLGSRPEREFGST